MSAGSGFGVGCHRFWVWGRERWIFTRAFDAIWDLEVLGPPLPEGPLVVAANHYSMLDVALAGKALGPVRYLAVDELYGRSLALDWFMDWWGGIPLPRGRTPLGAMRTALGHLDAGGRVALFPEGRRVWTWGEARPLRGAAWLAQRAGVPLLPVAIAGSEQTMGRGATRLTPWPIRVEVGEPIHPADYPRSVAGTWLMMSDWERWVDGRLRVLRDW